MRIHFTEPAIGFGGVAEVYAEVLQEFGFGFFGGVFPDRDHTVANAAGFTNGAEAGFIQFLDEGEADAGFRHSILPREELGLDIGQGGQCLHVSPALASKTYK